MDQRGPVALELLAQVAHVGLDHVGLTTEVVVPDVVQDLGLGEDLTGIAEEEAQEVELGRRQLDQRPRPAHLVRALVHLEIGELQEALVAGVDARPPEQGPDAGDDLGQGEGLGDVVVPADGEPGDLVLQRVAGREEQYGRPDPVGAQPPGDLEPVEVRKHDVEDDQVGRPFLCGAQGGPARHGLLDLEALVAQRGGDGVNDRRLVVDDQNPAPLRVHGAMSLLGRGWTAHVRGPCAPPVCPL